MLIPRFSLRILLLITTVSALFFFLITLGLQGRVWAIAGAVAASSLLLGLALFAVTFVVAWGMSAMIAPITRRPAATSPFAAAAPPPQQIVPPEDPD